MLLQNEIWTSLNLVKHENVSKSLISHAGFIPSRFRYHPILYNRLAHNLLHKKNCKKNVENVNVDVNVVNVNVEM